VWALTFWSADWTPCRALAQVAGRWPTLRFETRPNLRHAVTGSVESVHTARDAEAAVTAWEDPPRVNRRDAAPVLTVDGFEGRLDWWLEMARAQKIDLAKLSIATLIESFAAAMDAAPRSSGRRSAGASMLVRFGLLIGGDAHQNFRSRLLAAFRRSGGNARRSKKPRHMRRQLLDRARTRAAADFLERRVQLGPLDCLSKRLPGSLRDPWR